jgi:nitrate/nitrite transporter NarK
MAGIMIGSSLGFLGGWIAERHHWGYVFHIFGIAGIIYSVILVFVLKDIPEDRTEIVLSEKTESQINFLKGMKDLFRNRSFILILAYWGLLGIVGWIIIGWLPTYYQSHFNLSQGMAGLYATGYLYPAFHLSVKLYVFILLDEDLLMVILTGHTLLWILMTI